MTPPTEHEQITRLVFDTLMFFARPDIQGKSQPYYLKRVNHNTIERPWVDLESAQKYIEMQQSLADTYGYKIINYEILDIDNDQ